MHDRPIKKVASCDGAEYVADDELLGWQAQFLKIFFDECPQAFNEFKGPVYRELVILKARARLAAIDSDFRDHQLATFQARERRVSLAIFGCFHRHSSGNISASHLALCSEDHLPDLIPFRDTFLGWLRRYRLDQCQWVIEALLDSLKDFDQFPALF